jgi:hypothetical protein
MELAGEFPTELKASPMAHFSSSSALVLAAKQRIQ